MYVVLGNALFQYHLQEATASGAANKFAVDEVFDTVKNLIDQRIRAAGVYLLGKLPVIV